MLIIPPALVAQNAPVTTAGRNTDAVPGDTAVVVPITVKNFNDIGQFTLTMKFDTTRVRYVSAALNPSLPGMVVTYSPPVGNTIGKLFFNWTDSVNSSLADGSSLADLTFRYVTGTGLLSWSYTFGSICQYQRYAGNTLVPLSDAPKFLYYQNGGISNRSAPETFAPMVASPAPGPLPVVLTIRGFNSIRSLTLYLEYDPAIITYQNSFSKNPAFDSNFIVGDNPGTGGKRFIVIQWYSNLPVTLPDDSVLCTLDFMYPSATCNPCTLAWYDTGPTCAYTDTTGNVLIDMPQDLYYIDGIVASGLPASWTGNISNSWNEAGNWDACGMPDILRSVVIPDVSPNSFPVITVPASCYSLKIETGATLTVSANGSINVGK
jgi:hypothetical protein